MSDGERPPGTFTVTIDLPRVVGGSPRAPARVDLDPFDAAVRGVQRALGVANSVSRQMMVTGVR